jgi:hypothetical protein
MTATEEILRKQLVTSGLSSQEIEKVFTGLKRRAFFSSKIQAVRFLQTAQKQVADYLAANPRIDGAITSRASAISEIMAKAREEGIDTGTGKLTDPGSVSRAKVIVDTNAGLARGYVSHVQQSSTGARLSSPALELLRVESRQTRRNWTSKWTDNGGKLYGTRMIALKEDPVWTKISRFGVPYPPFDYGSGMGTRSVDYDTCLQLGVITEDYKPEGDIVENFNAKVEVELDFKGEDDPAWQFIKKSFGDQITYKDGKITWQDKS